MVTGCSARAGRPGLTEEVVRPRQGLAPLLQVRCEAHRPHLSRMLTHHSCSTELASRASLCSESPLVRRLGARWCMTGGGAGARGQAVSERAPERLQYLGASFGLTHPLLTFWRRAGYQPLYLRQTASDVTGAPIHPDLCHIAWRSARLRLHRLPAVKRKLRREYIGEVV